MSVILLKSPPWDSPERKRKDVPELVLQALADFDKRWPTLAPGHAPNGEPLDTNRGVT